MELMGDWTANMDLYVATNGNRVTVRVVSSFWELAEGWYGQDWGYV